MFGRSNKDLWCCKVTLAPGKSLDDVFTVCEAVKVDARNVIGAFAGVLTESRFQLLIKDPGSENYFTARDVAEDIAKKKKIKGYTFQENVLGSKKDMEKGCAAAGQTIFAYCPGLDAVLNLEVKRDTPEGEQRRQDMFAVGDIITQKVREGQQQQTNKIEKKVVEAATVIRDGVGKVLVTQSEVLVAEGRDNKKEIKETVNQRADQQMAFNAKMRQEMEQARLDREEAKRERLEAKRERMALTLQMKRMNRLLVQHAADQPLPELESEQLAFEYQDRGAEPVLTSPRGSSYERLVEPPSAGSGTLGVTPRTNSTEICRALGPKFSLLRDDRPSPESPEAYDDDDDDDDDDAIVEEAPLQGAVAAAALDHETVDEAPLQEATALSPVDAPPPADIASPAPAPAAEDDKGGVKALSTPARPTLERQIASVSRQFWEKHEEGKLRKIKDRTNKPSPLPQPSPPAEEG